MPKPHPTIDGLEVWEHGMLLDRTKTPPVAVPVRNGKALVTRPTADGGAMAHVVDVDAVVRELFGPGQVEQPESAGTAVEVPLGTDTAVAEPKVHDDEAFKKSRRRRRR